MRVLALAALFVLPGLLPAAAAQTRLTPADGALAVSGGTAGEAMRITTYAGRPGQRQRLSQRYRGITVNRSPRAASRGATGVTAGRSVAPVTRTPGGDFLRRPYGSFRVVRGR